MTIEVKAETLKSLKSIKRNLNEMDIKIDIFDANSWISQDVPENAIMCFSSAIEKAYKTNNESMVNWSAVPDLIKLLKETDAFISTNPSFAEKIVYMLEKIDIE